MKKFKNTYRTEKFEFSLIDFKDDDVKYQYNESNILMMSKDQRMKNPEELKTVYINIGTIIQLYNFLCDYKKLKEEGEFNGKISLDYNYKYMEDKAGIIDNGIHCTMTLFSKEEQVYTINLNLFENTVWHKQTTVYYNRIHLSKDKLVELIKYISIFVDQYTGIDNYFREDK